MVNVRLAAGVVALRWSRDRRYEGRAINERLPFCTTRQEVQEWAHIVQGSESQKNSYLPARFGLAGQ